METQQENKNKNTNKNRTHDPLFDQLEKQYRKKPIMAQAKNNPRYNATRRHRQHIEIVYDALKQCQEPTKLYRILQKYNGDKNRELVKKMIMNDLIEPSVIENEWIITVKGEELIKKIDGIIKDYPFMANKRKLDITAAVVVAKEED